MTPLLRTLEAWTVHQDYFWFLGMLAWLAVAYGAWRRDAVSGKRHDWLALLAAMFALICALEIALFALPWGLAAPFVEWWDFCLGLALSAAVGAMFQPMLDRLKPTARPAVSLAIASGLMGLAVWRWWEPELAGSVLGLCAAFGALGLLRTNGGGLLSPDATASERKSANAWWVLLAAIPALIDFGPVSYLTRNGRRFRDLSDFSLLSTLMCLAAGLIAANMMWRRYARTTAWSDRARGDLRTPVLLLAVWVAAGFVLTIGSGWMARRNYEEGIILRLQTSAAALDPEMLKVVLSPQLKLGPMSERIFLRSANKATDRLEERILTTTLNLAFVAKPPFEALAAKLLELDILNRELQSFRLLTIREGYILAAVSFDNKPSYTYKQIRPDGTTRGMRTVFGVRIIERKATVEDCVDLHTRRVILEPPQRGLHGSAIELRVPLKIPGMRQSPGWLASNVSVSIWRATFAAARFQTMLLVAIGVALWATAIGYRLRRLEREQAERIAREAAAADRAKSEFLAHVSHELRTPIQSVLGYAELLTSAPLGDLGRQRLAALRGQGDLLLRLVNDLIDLGALQASVFRLQPTTVDAAALTRECLETIRPQADARRLTLRLEIEPGIAWIEADGQRLRQVLLNLLTNAVKFTATGGITLGVRQLTSPAATLEWSVQDTGPGIAPEDQERIFQPFVRLDRDHAVAGAGMGLALCARLCTAMKGSIAVQSDGESGTLFVVRLPLHERSMTGAAQPGSATPATVADEAAWHGLRVLVADDNTLVRELLVAFFQERGADTTAVADGLAVVEICVEQPFDVIVLDLSMPWLDGRETARRLRRPGATPGQPWIIGLSAHAGREDADTAIAAGMDRFLTKPVSFAELSAAVAEAPGARARPASAAEAPGANAALAQRLAKQFFAETPAIVAEMRMALANQDRPRLRARAHYLKNSADVLGAEELRRACNALYVNADLAETSRLRELVVSVEAASRSCYAATEFSPDHPAQP